MVEYLQTTGKILHAQVGEGQSISTGASGHASTLRVMYFPIVMYQYTVDGVEYEGNRYWDEKFQIGQVEKIQQVIAKHPVGSSVTVHYNPNNPEDAFLEPLPALGLPVKPIMIAAGIGLLLLTAVIVLLIL